MRTSVTIFVVVISICIINASLLEPVVEKVVHIKASQTPHGDPGMWRKKTIWKPRWVKEWKSAKVMKPTYRKVWSPVLIKEWIPFPKPPQDLDSDKSTPLFPVPDSAQGKMPLWDPMPYPESQQPPPAPQSPPPFNKGNACGHHGGCHDSSSSAADAFTHDIISKIIGSNRFKKATDSSQSEYSESVSHSVAVPTDAETWRTRRQNSLRFHNEHSNTHPELPLYLVPPKLQSFRASDFTFQIRHDKPSQPTHANLKDKQTRISGNNQWTPMPSHNKSKEGTKHTGKVNLSNQPYKFQVPETSAQYTKGKPGNLSKQTDSKAPVKPQKPQNGPKLIQQAELVGEYHYSELDYQRHIRPVEQPQEPVKFKPLPPSAPIFTFGGKSQDAKARLPQQQHQQQQQQQQQQTQPSSAGKPRPIRKDVDSALNHHQVQGHHHQFPVTPGYEQEKGITKEIITIFNVTPVSFLDKDRYEIIPVESAVTSLNGTRSALPNGVSSTVTQPPQLAETTKAQSNSGGTKSVSRPEDALSQAFQKNHKDNGQTDGSDTASTNSTDESSTKSPVYIVTPVYQHRSN